MKSKLIFDTKHFTRTVDDGRLMFYLASFAKAGVTLAIINNYLLKCNNTN